MTIADATDDQTVRRGLAGLLPWTDVVAPWLLSRVVAVATLTCAYSVGRGRPWVSVFDIYDAGWYRAIADDGYGGLLSVDFESRFPFFPLLPGIMRGIAELGLPPRGTALVVNNLVFLAAMAGLFRITRRHLGAPAARYACWAIAFFPASAVFSMIYPSSIFLAASVWAFVFVEEQRDLAAAAVVLAAAAVRPNGIVVAVAVLLACRTWSRVAVVCGPAFAFVLVWSFLNWRWTGNPFAFYEAKGGWAEVSLFDVFTSWQAQAVAHVPLGVAGLVAVVVERRRLPFAWLVLTAAYLGPPLLVGTVGLGRYTTECFPVFAAGGRILERAPSWTRRAALAVGVLGLVAMTTMIARYDLTP